MKELNMSKLSFIAVSVLILLSVLTLSCSKMIHTDPGVTASHVAIAPDTTGQTGLADKPAETWRGPIEYPTIESQGFDMSPATVELRGLIHRVGDIRVCVYYNSRLSDQISDWSIDARGVIQMDIDQKGNPGLSGSSSPIKIQAEGDVTIEGKSSQTGTFSRSEKNVIYTEIRQPEKLGSMPIDYLLSDRIESIVTKGFTNGGAQVVDKTLLFRKEALEGQLKSMNETEIRALSKKVDILLEVTFTPNYLTLEGYDVKIKAVKVKDSTILTMESSSLIERLLSEEFEYLPDEGGFKKFRTRRYATLEYVSQQVTAEVMKAIARNW